MKNVRLFLSLVITTILLSAFTTEKRNIEFNSLKAGTYYLKMKHSGKYLTIRKGSLENGAILYQWEQKYKENQKFELVPSDSRYFRIKCVKSGKGTFFDITTNKCWSCPEGYRRTVYSVRGAKACERKN